jgi:hypothetical protein
MLGFGCADSLVFAAVRWLGDRKVAAEVALRPFCGRSIGRSLIGVPPRERVLLRATFEDASVHAFRVADTIAAVLVAGGGLIALAGIRNPRRKVAAELRPAGVLCGASQELVSAVRPPALPRGGLAA